jgi:hypothetical protein
MLGMVVGLGGLFAGILAIPPVRDFFGMTLLTAGQWFLALLCAALGLTVASVLWRLPQIERLESEGPEEDLGRFHPSRAAKWFRLRDTSR